MSENGEPEYRPIKLEPLQRCIIGILGAAGVGVGGVATFTTDSEAGPAVMLALGALFSLIAAVGYLPTRLKIGDNEAEWKAVGVFVQSAIGGAAPEDRPRLARSAEELVPQLPRREQEVVRSYLAWDNFHDAVKRIVSESDGQLTFRTDFQSRTFDYIIDGPGGGVALVTFGIAKGEMPEALDFEDVEVLEASSTAVIPVLLDGDFDFMTVPFLFARYQRLSFYDETDEPALRKAIRRATGV